LVVHLLLFQILFVPLHQVFLVVNLVLVFKPWVMGISQGFFFLYVNID